MTTSRRMFAVGIAFVVISLLGISQSSAQIDPESMVGLWLFNEGAGTVALDSTGHGYDADLEGGPAWVPGQFGQALSFEGSQYLEIRNSMEDLAFGGAAPFSVTAWVKPQGGGTIISKFNAGVVGAYIVRVSGTVSFHREVDPWSFSGAAAVANDEFAHVAVTYDGAVMRIYVNGALDAEQDRGAQGTDTVTPVLIGAQFTNGVPSEFFNGVLDEVALFNVALTEEQIGLVMASLTPTNAVSPIPADGAADVRLDTSLSWTAADSAATHNVYLGTSWEDVDAATTDAPLGVLAGEGLMEATYTPDDVLAYGQTYYWRVDEVNDTVVKGDIWSFTVEPLAYPIANITATSNATSSAGQGPENTINGSGLNADGEHSTTSSDMWLTQPGTEQVYVEYAFDDLYALQEMQVWNYNIALEWILGFGVKEVTIEYSVNGTDWTSLGDAEFAQGPGQPDYTAGTTVSLEGVTARYVRLTINSGYGTEGQYGLSETRFLHLPVAARDPQPADGATDIPATAELSWRPGRQAAQHDVYLSTDQAAVADGTAPVETVDVASYTADLDLDATYYWKVNEISEAETLTTWEGPVWSFSTQGFLVLDDFESYTDDEGQLIYETWIDGWDNGTGSTVGYFEAPFAETVIVHGGAQAMPLFYDNDGVTTAEAIRTFDPPQDWSSHGIQSLSLYFQGAQGNDGQLYVKINDTKITYSSDATDIGNVQWQPWIADLSGVGADLSRVTEVTIGIEGAGASGVVYVDDVRLYAKTPEFITPVEPDPTGLVLHYTFDEGSGSVAADSSGNGNDGTIEGSPAWITGASGTALGFDSSRDYVATGQSLLNDLTEFTIACWLKGDLSRADRGGLVGQNDCIEYGVSAANNIQIWSAASGAVNLTWPYDEDADWHHIVAVGNGSVVTIYLDGRPAVSGGTAITDTYGTSTYPVNIGGGGIFDATDNWLTGDVDEVYIYQRALSPAEVAGLAGRTAPLVQPF